jgi:hypothetical protein
MAAIQARNFQSNSLSGVVSISNGFANVVLSTTPFALEGDKSFVIKLRRGSIQGDVVATSPPITVQDNSSFVSLTANTSSVNEGNLVSFTLVTANAVNGATLFYSVNPVTANLTISDFYNGSNTGYLTLNNNQATFALYANTDSGYVDETGETFRVQLRSDSITGNVVYASTSNVVIIDTNKLYNVIGFTESSSSVTEGGTIILTFTAHNVPAGTIFYYSTEGNTTTATFASANTGSFVMNGLSNTISLVTASVPYGITQNFNVKIREGSPTGTLLATSNNLIVVDPAAINYMSATGGTIVDSGGYRVHTFTTSGNLTVSALGDAPSNFLDYLVVAGGGGATTYSGAGAGGFREVSGLSVIQGTTYTVIVGAGGSGTNQPVGSYGSDSTFSTITSTGGGRGVAGGPGVGGDGGSGGGGYGGLSPGTAGGSGNTPSTSPPQGNPGGRGLTDNINYTASGGGGGAGAVGGNAAYQAGGNGGSGAPSSISGSNVMYAGGGGGRSNAGSSGSGGTGGGGPATNTGVGTPGTINTGGGGGGGGLSPGGSGGSGIIIVRYPYVPPVTISNVVTTSNVFSVGSNITFTVNAVNANATTLYYSTDGNVTATNFIGGNTGSFVANTTGAVITLRANTNIPTNESRYFALQIRQDSTTGFISGSSANVTIDGFASQIFATGGNVITADGYRIHTFTSSNSFVITKTPQVQGNVEILLVGGGGGPGGWSTGVQQGSGGGGAGGVLYRANATLSAQTYPIVVGAGGGGGGPVPGVNGANTTAFGVIALGGGHGGFNPGQSVPLRVGNPGGSGGGGGAGGVNPGGNTIQISFAEWFKYGNPGVRGGGLSGYNYGGAGGGAGGAGIINDTQFGNLGAGGAGINFNISGSNVTYAAGGTGLIAGPAISAIPGSGNGGNGTSQNTPSNPGGPWASAGSPGIVIIRYPYS